ncbi:fructose-specific PTS system IIA component [Ligilactobacillus salitolerans]|uniref:Fructose-specific PTS system IIA component n=1 Tax=Ligilactobacillus salitolerans TaxID=1808352 RepID=A0A401IRE7_9LACO|nr:fructose PTS transporter subunit IIA [Ligilactobacillus salitolerans]GBG94074.1 fructose-specific PTS system IIA component [Ligilactobacillus salitolerans]
MSETQDFINEKNIIIGLDATDKEDAIFKMSQVLEKNGDICDAKKFYQDVLYRESLTTTGIGNNIAIPHGKSDTVMQPSLIFAKSKRPLQWNSLDGQPVEIIFLMAVGTADSGKEHLRMLAHLSGNLMNDDFVKQIKDANKTQDILDVFDEFKEDEDNE